VDLTEISVLLGSSGVTHIASIYVTRYWELAAYGNVLIVKQFMPLIGHEYPLPRLQEPIPGPYAEPVDSKSQ
jgi:hypothetical protein